MSTTSSCPAWRMASCCDPRTATPKSIRSIPMRRVSAPGVLAIVTAADWKVAGLGDLPSHAGLKRRDGSPMFKPRYTVLAEDRARWVGDPVAFIVAETTAQAHDAAEMIQVDYQELPAVTSTADATKPGSPRVYDDCPDNIPFTEFIGDKAACDAGFAKAAHVVKHRFVINRVTAACMEPRGDGRPLSAATGAIPSIRRRNARTASAQNWRRCSRFPRATSTSLPAIPAAASA